VTLLLKRFQKPVKAFNYLIHLRRPGNFSTKKPIVVNKVKEIRMSTSLAVQPAYRTTVTERSKANPTRTIFGTTLDNYSKCWTLLNDKSGK